jgi:hypothetical protein
VVAWLDFIPTKPRKLKHAPLNPMSHFR